MPRMGRVVLPHYPHHIVQRGHNRQVTFAERADYERYVVTVREFKEEYGVKVYGFCLMVRARMVEKPEDYAWSSCRYRLGHDSADWLDHDPGYLGSGENDNERQHRYRQFLHTAIPSGEWELIG